MIGKFKTRLLMSVGTLLGVGLGWLAWDSVLSSSQATFIVSIGQVGQVSPSGPIGQQVKPDIMFLEDPASFVERIRSPAFADLVAKRTNLPEDVVAALPARQYGGGGLLVARSLRMVNQGASNLIEVKIIADRPEAARAMAKAAADEIVEEHEKLLGPYVEVLKRRSAILRKQIDAQQSPASQAGAELNKKLSQLAPEYNDLIQVGLSLMTERRALELELSYYDSSLAIISQDDRKTMVLFPPAVSSPKRSWSILAPLFGGVAGLIFVMLGLRIWQELVRRRTPTSAHAQQ